MITTIKKTISNYVNRRIEEKQQQTRKLLKQLPNTSEARRSRKLPKDSTARRDLFAEYLTELEFLLDQAEQRKKQNTTTSQTNASQNPSQKEK